MGMEGGMHQHSAASPHKAQLSRPDYGRRLIRVNVARFRSIAGSASRNMLAWRAPICAISCLGEAALGNRGPPPEGAAGGPRQARARFYQPSCLACARNARCRHGQREPPGKPMDVQDVADPQKDGDVEEVDPHLGPQGRELPPPTPWLAPVPRRRRADGRQLCIECKEGRLRSLPILPLRRRSSARR